MKSILIALACIAFLHHDLFAAKSYRPSEKEKLSNEILAKAARKLAKKEGLRPCGTGGGTKYNVRMLALSFNYCGKGIAISEARELLLSAVDELAAEVNADERIRPYLLNYPFKPKNIEIRIFLYDPNRRKLPRGNLAVISALEGVLEYEIDLPKAPFLKTIYKETYEEAVTKAKEASLPHQKKAFSRPLKTPWKGWPPRRQYNTIYEK